MKKSRVGYRFEEMPSVPQGLSAGAIKYWNDLLPIIFELGTGRPADIPALVLLCEMSADVEALQDAIRREGFTTDAGSGGKKANPAMRPLEVARRQVLNLLDQFGLLAQRFPARHRNILHTTDKNRTKFWEDHANLRCTLSTFCCGHRFLPGKNVPKPFKLNYSIFADFSKRKLLTFRDWFRGGRVGADDRPMQGSICNSTV